MKKIHWLILRSFIGPFLVVFFIALFVLLMQFMWRYVDELVGKGLEFLVIAEFLLYTTATLVPMALPLAILMSSLMTFGNLGERYELTAMKASGISLQRIMSPMIILIVLIGFGEFFFVNEVWPYSNEKLYTLLNDIRDKRPVVHIQEGEFYGGIDNYSIRVNHKDQETNKLYDIIIYNHSEGHNLDVTIADSGKMEVTSDDNNIVFTLWSGYKYVESQDLRKTQKHRTYPHQYVQFDEQTFVIKLIGYDLERTEGGLFKDHHAMLDVKMLSFRADSINREIKNQKLGLLNELTTTNVLFLARSENSEDNNENISHVNKRKLRSKTLDENELETEIINDTISDDTLSNSANRSELLRLSPDSLYAVLSPSMRTKLYYLALTSAKQTKSRSRNIIPSVSYKISVLRRYEIEWHKKFVLSFACIIFLFLGAPLGAIIRKGGLGLPLVISTIFFIFWYIINLTTEKMVRESILSTYLGMWLPSFIFFTIGMFLTYKATTDAQMMNMDTYSNFFKKIFGQRYRLIDVLLNEQEKDVELPIVKISNFRQTLKTMLEEIEKQIETTKQQIKPFSFIISFFGMQESTHLILFERYYKNIFRSIIRTPLYHNRRIRSKIEEFPDVKANYFIDSGYKLLIKLALISIVIISSIFLVKQNTLIFIPIVLTVLILMRHYILILTLRNRLLSIQQSTKELYKLIDQEDEQLQ